MTPETQADSDSIDVPRFESAVAAGEIVEKSGYHQPDNGGRSRGGGFRCSCEKTTRKGAYRDVTVDMPGGNRVFFYHQSPVVVRTRDGRYRLDSHGYRSSTTKERISRHLPRGYKVVQRDFEWFVKSWDPLADYDDRDPEMIEFEDGMVVEP